MCERSHTFLQAVKVFVALAQHPLIQLEEILMLSQDADDFEGLAHW